MLVALQFLCALAKAIPAVEAIMRAIVREIDAGRERTAQQRMAEKNAAVDAALKP